MLIILYCKGLAQEKKGKTLTWYGEEHQPLCTIRTCSTFFYNFKNGTFSRFHKKLQQSLLCYPSHVHFEKFLNLFKKISLEIGNARKQNTEKCLHKQSKKK